MHTENFSKGCDYLHQHEWHSRCYQHRYRTGKYTLAAKQSFYRKITLLIDAGQCPVGII